MVRAAAWSTGAVLGRTTAAWWHGMIPELSAPLTLSAPHPVSVTRLPGIEVDAVRRSFCAEDVTEVSGVAVTSKALSALGAVALLDDPSRFLDDQLRTGALTIDELRRTLDRNPRMRGLAPARRLLGILDADTQSAAERLFRKLLRDAGVTDWVQQHSFGGWSLDFAWPDLKISVEIDGWAFHRSHKTFRRDMAKRNALVLAGWLPLTFAWHDLVENPVGCLELLVSVIRERLVTRDT